MNRIILSIALASVVAAGADARIVVTRSSQTPTREISLLDGARIVEIVNSRSGIESAVSAMDIAEEPLLINTGVRIADVQSGSVSLELLREITMRKLDEAKPGLMKSNSPHSSAAWASSAKVIRESMDNFTLGSQSSPVAVSNSGMQISAEVLGSGTDNLYGYGVYSLGGGLGALMGSSNEFRIIDIQAATPLNIGIWVGALQQNAGIDLNLIEGANGTSFLMNSSPTSIPYDGNIYWLETSTNGFKDKNNQAINANVSLLVMGANGSADTDLAFAGIWVDGERYSGGSGGTSGGGTGGGGTGGGTVSVGKPSGISYSIASDKQSFTINYSAADKATHHEAYVFNDIVGPATADVLNVDWSPLNVGTSDYTNPLLTYYMQNVALSEIPGGMCHWPVLVNGALGFGYLGSVISQTNSWAGFETSDYDLSSTGGVASISFQMYPTDYTVFVLNEYALNKSTQRYELVDSAELDGSEIQWNAWDDFNVTLDVLNSSKYDLEHVYFMFGLVSEAGDDSCPSFLYFRKMHISASVPAGKTLYYLHDDREVEGSEPIMVKGDIPNNRFNFCLRGNYHGDTDAYGEFQGDPNGNTIYVAESSGINTLAVGDNGDPEYFDLHGRRIVNPAAGIYVVRVNGKIEKRIVE